MNFPLVGSRRLVKALLWLLAAGVLALSAWLGQRPSARYLLLLGGGLGLVVLLQHPGLGLAVLAALSFTLPLTIGTGSEVSLTAPVLLIPAVALVWLLDGLRKRSLSLPASRSTLPLLLFTGSGLFSLLAGNVYWDPLIPKSGNFLLVQLAQWGILLLSAAIYLLAGELGARERWLRVATWTFLVVGGVVVLEFYLPPLRRALGWSSSNLANRSMFWTWLAALATGQLVFNRRLGNGARFGLLALLLAAGYVAWFRLNDSVSTWVPLTVAILAVIWLRVWRRNRTLGLVVVLLFVWLAVLLYPILFLHAGGERELQMSWGGRQVLYKAVLDLVAEHPILGLGPAAYRHYGHTRWLSLGFGRALYLDPNISSHNNYIDVYAQQGLLGLGLFLWFLVELGLLGWRLAPRFRGDFNEGYVYGAIGGLAGTLVAMLLADWFIPFVYNIGFPGFRTSALAWMFLGGLVALEQRPRGRGSKGEEEQG